MGELEGKAALITGAAHPLGIGRAIAEQLGSQGATILIGDIDKNYMDLAVRELAEKGIKAFCYDMDAGNIHEVENAVKQMAKDAGGIDILVNNVGGSHRISREELASDGDAKGTENHSSSERQNSAYLGISTATVEQWHKIINANLNSAFYCTKAVLPYMIGRGYGRIINFSSIVARRGVQKSESFTSGPYAVAKAAIIGFTRQLALELAEYGINVNAVAPGYVLSGRGQSLKNLPKEQQDALLQSIPKGRFAEPHEVASVVLALCTEQFKYVTGQTIDVNGGMYFS